MLIILVKVTREVHMAEEVVAELIMYMLILAVSTDAAEEVVAVQ
jgi:hypothetical protein